MRLMNDDDDEAGFILDDHALVAAFRIMEESGISDCSHTMFNNVFRSEEEGIRNSR